jgi:hypothetical protein
MDIYSFFNSSDVARHCQSIGHTFNALECAVMINQSKTRSLAEKHAAYRALIAEYPDMETPQDTDERPVKSFRESLGIIIEYQEKLLERFLMPEPEAVYQARIYEKDGGKSKDLRLCLRYEGAYKNALQSVLLVTIEYSAEIKVTKKYLGSCNSDATDLVAKVTWQGGITSVVKDCDPYRDGPVECELLKKYVNVPVPFVRGDLVEDSDNIYVLLSLDKSDMAAYIMRADEKGVISYRGGFIPNFRYCRRELTGPKRILKYISLHIKGELSLEYLLQAQKKVMLDALMDGMQGYHIMCDFKEMGDDLFETGRKVIDGVVFSRDKTVLLKAPEGLTGDYAIPDGVRTIDVSAFMDCALMTGVMMPGSVRGIECQAFERCKSLTSLTLSEGLEIVGSEAFAYCSKLASVTLPNSLLAIHTEAFEGCESLTSISIPANVLKINYSVFDNCNLLTHINVDANNPRYTDIDGVLFTKDMKTLVKYPEGKEQSEYIIPDGVTEVGMYGLFRVASLKTITIPGSMTSIKEETVHSCKALTKIIIMDGVTEIESLAFLRCDSLTDVVIPDSVKEISEDAFYDKEAMERERKRISKQEDD